MGEGSVIRALLMICFVLQSFAYTKAQKKTMQRETMQRNAHHIGNIGGLAVSPLPVDNRSSTAYASRCREMGDGDSDGDGDGGWSKSQHFMQLLPHTYLGETGVIN